MRCFFARRWLSPYVDGELPSGRAARLEAHLSGCPRCAAELAEHRAVWQELAGLPCSSPPPGLEHRIASAAGQRGNPAAGGLLRLRPRFAFGLAVGLSAAVGVALGVLVSGSGGPSGGPAMSEHALVVEAFGDSTAVPLAGLLPHDAGRTP